MKKITLDTNCLIDVEEKRKGYKDILKIYDLHRGNKIKLGVVAVMSADKKIDGRPINNFSQFKKWVKKIGLKNIEIISTLAYNNNKMSFYNSGFLYSGPELKKLERRIHKILFPELPFERPQSNLEIKKWRGKKIDVLMMWGHIWNKRDYFITRDKNFLKNHKKKALIKLGAKNILTPEEFLKIYNKST
jgi:hypothetical protein